MAKGVPKIIVHTLKPHDCGLSDKVNDFYVEVIANRIKDSHLSNESKAAVVETLIREIEKFKI